MGREKKRRRGKWNDLWIAIAERRTTFLPIQGDSEEDAREQAKLLQRSLHENLRQLRIRRDSPEPPGYRASICIANKNGRVGLRVEVVLDRIRGRAHFSAAQYRALRDAEDEQKRLQAP